MNNLMEKLIATGISIGGGFVGAKLVEFTWKKVTGHDAPKNPEDTDANMWSAITFATISAGISALIKASSKRGADKAVRAAKARSAKGHPAGAAEV